MEEIGIESSLVQAIRQGKKTVEVRLGRPRFLKMREGDMLSIREDIREGDKMTDGASGVLQVHINEIAYFESFSEMLDAIDFKMIDPSAQSADDALNNLGQFYTIEDEVEFGIVALFFEVVQAK